MKPNGKFSFELFANFGGATDLAFYPPWIPASKDDLFPPRTEKANMTMKFLGYTHVKPVRRQWEIPVQTPGQYRYNPPGSGSAKSRGDHLLPPIPDRASHASPDSG
jgi:hypothetical protein